ncbi:glycosyl transferase 2 family protein [[Clostridium] bifermentans ATCC 638]|uniref:Glycosyl transferase 2 family protein n=1 Tax=Paraclostridium bifermentans ATCC 638 = DSM 14991 TaxID=1233171 RepID=T4VJN3_PARBF|nr:glycosyltransferase family 2 protein [Paraclostridium bifermentans]EQK43929.1 glycosyl transferase 2 family protein [[Clostridium] bifermentans ATCC 638] [Paraclostridium bifermentans ATCC 638 = DSM 14991]RIZ59380.1 glycosyltransferase family 2 protein [Paraclostridium bifermentans]UAG17752.1 glycosyltransferase family 2 protein [Paraclostridium bifermentans]
MKVLLIIPAYNEEDNIVRVVNNIEKYSKQCEQYILDYIVINDGSTDNTKYICKKNNIKCINLINNLGIGGAVQTGYIFAKINNYDIAVQFDGDGQHDINSLDDVIKPILNKEADFTIGSRFIEDNEGFKSTLLRRIGIKYLSFIIKLCSKVVVRDCTSGYRAGNKNAIEYLSTNYPVDYPEPESIISLTKANLKIKEVHANMFSRESGVSSISSWKSIYYMIKVSLAIVCASFEKRVRC